MNYILTKYSNLQNKCFVSSFKQQELLAYPSRTPDSPLVFGGVRFANLFCFLFLDCFVMFVFVLCPMWPMLVVFSGLSIFYCLFGFLSSVFLLFLLRRVWRYQRGNQCGSVFIMLKSAPSIRIVLCLYHGFVSKTIFLSDVSITWLFNPPTMSAQYACYFWTMTCVRTTFYICVFLKIATSIFCKQ